MGIFMQVIANQIHVAGFSQFLAWLDIKHLSIIDETKYQRKIYRIFALNSDLLQF